MGRLRTPEALVRRYQTRDPFVIADGEGIPIHFLNHPESGLPGLTCLVANRPSIFINQAFFDIQRKEDPEYTEDTMEDDVRQVAAHELGHAIKHRRALRRAPIREYEIFNVRSQMEVEANTFAAGILIDPDELMDCVSEKRGLLEMARILHVNINLLIYRFIQMDTDELGGIRLEDMLPRGNFMGRIHGAKSSGWD